MSNGVYPIYFDLSRNLWISVFYTLKKQGRLVPALLFICISYTISLLSSVAPNEIIRGVT